MNINGVEFSFGADPELFIWDNWKGEFVGANGLIPGTKKEPYSLSRSIQVQKDGLAAEFNVSPTVHSGNIVGSVVDSLNLIKSHLNSIENNRYSLVAEPYVFFTEEEMGRQLPEDLALGCDPDFNAYTGKQNPTPSVSHNFRTGSGHIHIGWTSEQDPFHPEHFEACRMLTMLLDRHVGLIERHSYMPSNVPDLRRSLYGKAGAFRPKPYGMEYRTPSNIWLSYSPSVMSSFLVNVIDAIGLTFEQSNLDSLIQENTQVNELINRLDCNLNYSDILKVPNTDSIYKPFTSNARSKYYEGKTGNVVTNFHKNHKIKAQQNKLMKYYGVAPKGIIEDVSSEMSIINAAV